MPIIFRDEVYPETQPAIRVNLEPAHSAVMSLMLLCKEEPPPGVSDWVIQTRLAMSEEERSTNLLVLNGLHYVVQPMESWPSLPAYIDHLSRLSPEALRDKMLDFYDRMPVFPDALPDRLDLATALDSSENYLAYLKQRFPEENIDEEIELRSYELLQDPPAMRQVVVDHLWRMWRKYLKAEWERVLPILRETLRAYRQVDFSQHDFLGAIRFVTGQDHLEETTICHLNDARRLVFVPHPHAGPYMLKAFTSSQTMLVFFSPRPPRGMQIDIPELSRAEIVIRLSALADDTRLRILRHIAEHGEQRSQEIMEALDLSQSAASRHLTQLTATGYLKERRCDGAKCYALNPDRISDTFQAITNFLLVNERTRI